MDVSAIITVYNDGKHIERAIRSCLNQTLPLIDYEIIVVDDGSTDSTPDILETYKMVGVKVITNKNNLGVGLACNEGIKRAKGRFIVRIDSDDYINEHMLEIERLYLTLNKDMPAVACDYYMVDAEENIIGRKNPIELPIACGVMFRKDKLLDVGLYKDLRLWEEKELFSRFVEKHGIYRIALPLYRYFQREGSLSRQ